MLLVFATIEVIASFKRGVPCVGAAAVSVLQAAHLGMQNCHRSLLEGSDRKSPLLL